jgi:hypothetical protein
MAFISPRQLGVMDYSDLEMQLINDVALLDSRLSHGSNKLVAPATKQFMPMFSEISMINHSRRD